MDNLLNSNYKKVSIEINDNSNFNELKKLLDAKGETEIKIVLKENDNKFTFKLENLRKFDLKLFNEVKIDNTLKNNVLNACFFSK